MSGREEHVCDDSCAGFAREMMKAVHDVMHSCAVVAIFPDGQVSIRAESGVPEEFVRRALKEISRDYWPDFEHVAHHN